MSHAHEHVSNTSRIWKVFILLSVVTIVFDDDIDIYWARQQVSERLQQVQNQISISIKNILTLKKKLE